jgi:hypothetical protein
MNCVQCQKKILPDSIYIEFFGDKVFCSVLCQMRARALVESLVSEIKKQENYKRFFYDLN